MDRQTIGDIKHHIYNTKKKAIRSNHKMYIYLEDGNIFSTDINFEGSDIGNFQKLVTIFPNGEITKHYSVCRHKERA